MCNYTNEPITFSERQPGHTRTACNPNATREWKGCMNHPTERLRGKTFFMTGINPLVKDEKPYGAHHLLRRIPVKKCYEKHGFDTGEVLRSHMQAILRAKKKVCETFDSPYDPWDDTVEFLPSLKPASLNEKYCHKPLPEQDTDRFCSSSLSAYGEQICQMVPGLHREASEERRSETGFDVEDQVMRFNQIIQLEIARARISFMLDKERQVESFTVSKLQEEINKLLSSS